MKEWILTHEMGLLWISLFSLVSFIGTVILIPLIIVGIPEDYFAHGRRGPTRWRESHPAIRMAALAGKNLLGAVFIASGIAMLFLPGQGLMTILIGLMLTNFPGKLALEKWIIRRKTVKRAVDWLRYRYGKPSLRVHDGPAPDCGRRSVD